MIEPWNILQSRIDKDYKIFRIRVDEAKSPRNSAVGEFYTLESNSWVNVVPLTADGHVVLIRQYRHGSRDIELEIPGGLVEGEDPGEAAVRELLEETGFAGSPVTLLGSTNPNPAIFNNLCYTYLVEHVELAAGTSLDLHEDIDVELVPLHTIPGLIANGTINHALVIVAFHFYFQARGFPSSGPCCTR